MRFSSFSAAFLLFFAAVTGSLRAQSLSIVSGNGQLVSEQFLTTVPLVVQARDASGKPAVGVAVTWMITQGLGTLVGAISTTDANGQASTLFLGTSINPSSSIAPATVTASTSLGTANFVVTTVVSHGFSAPPLVELVTPPLDNRVISGRAGSTLPGGVVVRVTVQSGPQTGAPVPNIAVRLVDAQDPMVTPGAMCNGPNGVVLTDSQGLATCNVVIGSQTGTFGLKALAGEAQNTGLFSLQVTPGIVCTFALSAGSQAFSASGGTGSVSVISPAGCGWTAVSSASWIAIASGAAGSGNGLATYSVAANAGVARTGTLLIAGQTYTVTQSAVGGTGPSPLTITTGSNLTQAVINASYAATFTATGGTPPYTWSANGTLPPGLALATTAGVLAGTPSSAGTFTFPVAVTDSAGVTVSLTFSLNVLSNSGSLTITNTAFPNGVAGQPYQQPLTSSGGCVTPFSPVPVFSLAGGALPAGLSLQGNTGGFSVSGTPTTPGTSNFTVAVQDACGNKAAANFALIILSVAGSAMTVTPGSLAFSLASGSPSPPAIQALSIASSGTALSYNATAATTTGGNWLALGTPSGTTPASLTVGIINYTQLAQGTYNGTITITSTASNSPVLVPVTLTITAGPTLTVIPANLAFTQPASGATVLAQAIQIGAGSAAVPFIATPNTISGGPWLLLSSNAGTTPATLTANVNSAGLAPGTYVGSILIAAATGGSQVISVILNVPASATLTVTPPALSFVAPSLSGVPPTQLLNVTSSAGATNFTSTAATAAGTNWLIITPQAGTTPAGVSVTTNASGLPVGSYTGVITITAADTTIPPVNVPVVLTVGQTSPALRGITNAASFAPGPIAPGELITLFGSGMGPSALAAAQFDSSGNVANLNAGTQVLFDGIAAPVIYTSETQVAVIVPYGIFGRDTVAVQLTYRGVSSNSIILRVADSSPAIFTGAILNPDGSANSPQSGTEPGSIVVLFATGEGQTDPPGTDGKIITPDLLPHPQLPVSVLINGQAADVRYAGGAPGLAAGILQVNVRVPDNVPGQTQVPVVLTVGSQHSPTVLLTIK